MPNRSRQNKEAFYEAITKLKSYGLGVQVSYSVDHVHMLLSIPPKYGVAEVVGYLKGKSAIEIAKHFEKVRKITGASFWARGYFVSTVGVGEREIRLYIRNQEKEDRKVEQLKLL